MDFEEKLRMEFEKKLTDVILESIRKEPGEGDVGWMDLLLAAYYNVVSDQIDDYGGNTDRMATFLSGVNALANEMINLAGEVQEAGEVKK